MCSENMAKTRLSCSEIATIFESIYKKPWSLNMMLRAVLDPVSELNKVREWSSHGGSNDSLATPLASVLPCGQDQVGRSRRW